MIGSVMRMVGCLGLALALVASTQMPAFTATPDLDADGLPASYEVRVLGTDPGRADSDDDAIPDGAEDGDLDGLTDLWEARLRTRPDRPDSDRDGIPDGAEDSDRDRIPDALEIAWASDPGQQDTDRDGIPDGAEDLDRDGLSAAGEARVGTHPSRADTDGDGVDDWHDDADGDGRPDGPRQDARPIPPDLVPSLAAARQDRPRSYRDGCHQSSGLAPTICAYGSTAADALTVVLFGDSHAAQWLPAIEMIGRPRGWRIINITRSSCPVPDVTIIARRVPGLGSDCDVWRQEVLRAIARLRPDLVIAASYVGYEIVGTIGKGLASRRTAWLAGWRRSLRSLRRAATSVVVLGDTPQHRRSAVECLTERPDDIARCGTPRRAAIHAKLDTLEARVARGADATYIETTALICPYDPCPVIIDDRLLVFDTGHLNASTARQLAPGLALLLPGLASRVLPMRWLLPRER